MLKLCMQKKGRKVNFSIEDQKWIDFHKFLEEKRMFPKDLWSETTEKRIEIVREYKEKKREGSFLADGTE